MSFFGDNDITGMLSDWNDSITIAGTTHGCLLDERDEEVQDSTGAPRIMHLLLATVRTSDFPNVQQGDAVVIESLNYKVWRKLQEGDGATIQLLLQSTDIPVGGNDFVTGDRIVDGGNF